MFATPRPELSVHLPSQRQNLQTMSRTLRRLLIGGAVRFEIRCVRRLISRNARVGRKLAMVFEKFLRSLDVVSK